MEFLYKRRLIFAAGPKWKGWLCERCCWNQPQPEDDIESLAQARRIQSEFNKHECEEFALANWPKPINSR